MYRYLYESHFDTIAIVAGVVQTLLYADFFYLYITKGARTARRPSGYLYMSLLALLTAGCVLRAG